MGARLWTGSAAGAVHVYRQLMYLAVIQSVWNAPAGSRVRWQRMEGYGALDEPEALPDSDLTVSAGR